MSYDIFISYRRKDSKGHSNVGNARTFYLQFDKLGYKVFFDYNDCTDNVFSDEILPAIRTCTYFLLILTKDTLERCNDKGDWLRREIEEALKYDKKIIPVTPDDNKFESWPDNLPESLSPLAHNGGLQVTTIHMDRMFAPNIEVLINDRMGKPSSSGMNTPGSGAEVHVETDYDCHVMHFKKEVMTALAEEDNVLYLKKGSHKLEFVAEKCPEVKEVRRQEIEALDSIYFIEVKLEDRVKEVREERRQRKEEEKKRKEAAKREKEQKRKEEEERKQQEEERLRKEKAGEFCVEGVDFKMVYVEGGSFMMGAAVGDKEARLNEKLAHIKVLLDDYYIGETVVTQKLWKAVMGKNPSIFEGDDNPVEFVSWNACQVFIQKLNALTGRTFRLPTEAEWEFAARGGNKSQGYKYSGSDELDKVGWYDKNSHGKSHPVKGKACNELGLYDMSGNVFEWCNDWLAIYSADPQTNPEGPKEGRDIVVRGGGLGSPAQNCRVSYRLGFDPREKYPSLGFRLALDPESTAER